MNINELHALLAKEIENGHADTEVMMQTVIDGFTSAAPCGGSMSDLEGVFWIWLQENEGRK